MFNPSQQCINFVKQFEGFKSKAYLCPAGVWTVGYGTTSGITSSSTMTEPEASKRLEEDLNKFWLEVSKLIKVPLNQNQVDALCSFVYNIGSDAFSKSTLLNLLNQGKYSVASEQFLRWDKAKGKALPGLTRRRIKEKELFDRK